MSSHRHKKERERHERMASIYDDFAEHVKRNVRNRTNPDVCVREFDLMPKESMTHMELYLENVSRGNRELFDSVEAFGPGTKLITKEAVVDGSQLFVALVPHSPDQPEPARHGKRRHRHGNDEPNPFLLLFWILLLFLVLFVAVWKTQWTQWTTLYGFNTIQ